MVDDSCAEVVGDVLQFDDDLDYALYLTEDVANNLIARCIEEGVDEVSFRFFDHDASGWMTLGIDDLVRIEEGGLTLDISWNYDFSVYEITVVGPEGLTVDVDLPGMSSFKDTRVYTVSESGETQEVYSINFRNDVSLVRFTVSESGLYNTYRDDNGPELRAIMFYGSILILAVAAYIICWYAIKDEKA